MLMLTCVTVFFNPQISDHLNNNIHCHSSTQFNLVLAKQRVLKKKKKQIMTGDLRRFVQM